ncbi:MAG TPA: helix-turn-helix domain-containing protein [Mycobacteriales bacterium]|nr:helix-turn-helix domain-containing protein [Mycobacteriales bacterium]
MVTVEADPVGVESRLVSGGLGCPGCAGGVLRPWGWVRPRSVHGIEVVLRPRRARCAECLITHVLLPVTVLLRRAYAAEVIGAALVARGAGRGHRWVGLALKVPAATVRGWLRVMAGRLEASRVHLLRVACLAGVDVVVPEAVGCAWRDLLAALGVATAAVRGRFGPLGVLGPVTGWQVAVACSAGRLLAPGWPPPGWELSATPVASDVCGG